MRNMNSTQTHEISHKNIKHCFSPDDTKERPLRKDQSLAVFELGKTSAPRPSSQYKRLTAHDWSVQELDSLEDKESTPLHPHGGRSANGSTQQMYHNKSTESRQHIESRQNSIQFKSKPAPRKLSQRQQSKNLERDPSFHELSQSTA